VRYVALGVCLLVGGRAAIVQALDGSPHVRAESSEMRELIAETALRSPTFRALVDEIDGSDVIVYVRPRLLPSASLEGRIGFVASQAGTRFLAIELAVPRGRNEHMATLAHELQHAIEIARAPWVVGPATLARYYSQIGIAIANDPVAATFESEAARAVGARVRREIAVEAAALQR